VDGADSFCAQRLAAPCAAGEQVLVHLVDVVLVQRVDVTVAEVLDDVLDLVAVFEREVGARSSSRSASHASSSAWTLPLTLRIAPPNWSRYFFSAFSASVEVRKPRRLTWLRVLPVGLAGRSTTNSQRTSPSARVL